MNIKLNEKVQIALGENLVRWLRIAHNQARDKGFNPLCKLFIKNVDCEGCPIKAKTGQPRCVGTPFPKWLMHHVIDHRVNAIKFGYRVECDECKELARDMFDFYLDIA